MSVLRVVTILLFTAVSPSIGTVPGTVTPDEGQPSTMTCNSCCQGPAGANGVNGVPGIPGSPGGYGPQGPVGPKGEIGQPGIHVKGEKGEVGIPGLPGVKGEVGIRGAAGKVGPVGIQGPPGEDGLDGAPGIAGPRGEKGESGMMRFSGFTVAKTSPQSGIGIVTFDTVITDVAGNFDTNSHKFTCQISGYYLFTFAIFSLDNNRPLVTLMKNGEKVVAIYTHPSGTSNYRNMGSNSALVMLASGDQVWLYNHHDTIVQGSSSWMWTTFSGILLHEICGGSALSVDSIYYLDVSRMDTLLFESCDECLDLNAIKSFFVNESKAQWLSIFTHLFNNLVDDMKVIHGRIAAPKPRLFPGLVEVKDVESTQLNIMSVLSVVTILLFTAVSPSIGTVPGTVTPDEGQPSTMTCNSCCQGPMGVPGIPGIAGSPGGYGPLGPVGPKGEIGQPGIHVKGERGEVGMTGLPGARGQVGVRGAPGKVGPVGIQGPRGEDGLNGAPGIAGPRGEKGESGMMRFSGFTVAKTSSQSGVGIVTFDTVITDVAENFDTNSHKFTCQIPGYYLFTFAIFSLDNNSPLVALTKNGEKLVAVYTHPSGTSNYRNVGCNSALVMLTSGDQVWLYNHHNTQLYGNDNKYTTFSGILLHEMLNTHIQGNESTQLNIMSVLSVVTILLFTAVSPSIGTVTPGEGQPSTMTGNSCCQGPAGANGVNGIPGIPGSPGGYGPLGPVGPKGEIGQPGIHVKGEKGEVGTSGLSGAKGEVGIRGAPGKVGPVGIQGPHGEDGLDGAPGNAGPRGEKGESGMMRFSGFTVAKTSPQSGVGIVTFDTVITDVAGNFDTNSHKFTCQIPGYYLFTFAITSYDANWPLVALTKNDEKIVSVYTHPSGTSNYRNIGSNSALVILASGDQVWLHNHHDKQIRGDGTWKYTTFSGILLHEV
ncbi:uncharacterized protein [Amphiura filiformis]|uniref:uncharacterized protein n=1 Tax=Amphiura filiformis TaxID=82378 RepID=UPI003B223224